MMQRANPFHSWRVFTKALEMDFGPFDYECLRSTLFKLMQTGTVGEYYLEFTALANRVDGLSTDSLMDCFLSGLQVDICRDVKAMSPTNMAKAVALAKLFEERYEPNSKPKFTNSQARTSNTNLPYQKYNYNSTNTKTNQPPLLPTPNPKPLHQTQKNPKIKYISPAKMQVRRDKGLCYWCDDKFSFSHKCPNKYLMMLQLIDDSDLEAETKPLDITIATAAMLDGAHHLSLNAMRGFTGVGTIRFTGHINNISVQILVDSGSSETFLEPRIAKFLKLPIEAKPSFSVLVGNGQIMETEGWVRQLPVDIQG